MVAVTLTAGPALCVSTPATAAPTHSASVAVAKTTSQRKPHGHLQVTLTGAPQGAVQVNGPKTHLTVSKSSVLTLRPGTYRVRATNVDVAGDAFIPADRRWRIKLHRGNTKIVTVRYSHVGTSAPGKADNDAPPQGELGTLFTLVNEARSRTQQCGTTTMPPVDAVVYDNSVGVAAQRHAEDMAAKDYFEHESLDGRTFIDRISATGYDGQAAGENIAMGFQSAEDVLQGWLNSPGHCLNLMNPEFDEMGLGLASRQDPRYATPATYWVQDFGYAPGLN